MSAPTSPVGAHSVEGRTRAALDRFTAAFNVTTSTA